MKNSKNLLALVCQSSCTTRSLQHKRSSFEVGRSGGTGEVGWTGGVANSALYVGAGASMCQLIGKGVCTRERQCAHTVQNSGGWRLKAKHRPQCAAVQ